MGYSIGPNGIDLNGTTLDGPEDLGSPTTFNTVGTYAIFSTGDTNFSHSRGNVTVGNTRSASDLVYNSSTYYNALLHTEQNYLQANGWEGGGFSGAAHPSGTWRNMGSGASFASRSSAYQGENSVNLWVRTA